MPPFRNEPSEWQREDWKLLQNGYVHLFWNDAVLDRTARWLADDGYVVVTLDASGWTTKEDILVAIGEAFSFPDYYGRNLDALNDCMSDVATFAYGSSAASSGTALVLTRFDRYVQRQPDVAQTVLDIVAGQARRAALIGHRMLFLVQSDDPDLRLAPVGAAPVMWNPAEWLNSKRHPGDR